jgi:glycosyltransferase involved in cell wall biosynthesis
VRAVFVYPNPRRSYSDQVAKEEAPDSPLLGQNHLELHGIDARIHDPLLSRLSLPGPLARAAWIAREPLLPLELGRADVLFTGLANVLPLAARLRRLPTVVLNYGLNQIYRRSGRERRRLLRASLGAAGRVVCFGSTQRDELVGLGVVADERAVALPFGIDERWFTPRVRPPGEPVVLAVGKDLARDYATFAAALGRIDARAEVVALPRNLVGVDLPLNAVARQLDIGDLRERYAQSAVVVVPQRRADFEHGADGGLTVLLEAMAMGRPVVASDRPLVREYVDDGVEALLVPPEDPEALRAAIEQLLGDAERAGAMGAAGRARVERAHTTRAFAAGLAPVLRSVV